MDTCYQCRTTARSNMLWVWTRQIICTGYTGSRGVHLYLLVVKSDRVTAVANVTLCSPKHIYWPLGGTHCFHHQDWCKGIRSSETSVSFYQIKPRPSPQAVRFFSIQINHQPDATVFQFIIVTFIYSSTCFGRCPAHHQEHLTLFIVSDSVHPSCCRLAGIIN